MVVRTRHSGLAGATATADDLEWRAGHAAARDNYQRAIALAWSPAERVSFERRIESLKIS